MCSKVSNVDVKLENSKNNAQHIGYRSYDLWKGKNLGRKTQIRMKLNLLSNFCSSHELQKL